MSQDIDVNSFEKSMARDEMILMVMEVVDVFQRVKLNWEKVASFIETDGFDCLVEVNKQFARAEKQKARINGTLYRSSNPAKDSRIKEVSTFNKKMRENPSYKRMMKLIAIRIREKLRANEKLKETDPTMKEVISFYELKDQSKKRKLEQMEEKEKETTMAKSE